VLRHGLIWYKPVTVSILNLALYAFVPLDTAPGALPRLRDELREMCEQHGLKGTILLAPEGINAFVAGVPAAVESFESLVRERTGLVQLVGKRSWSETVPFRRLFVKIKPEIIPLGQPALTESERPAKALSPAELRQWIEEGRAFTLLDVRNGFEFEMGTFRGAEHLGLTRFRELAEKARAQGLPDRTEPVVTFCTGGIRCEKAVPCLESLGMRDVYLLEGGILKYFEEFGSEHFEGACFVFDERVALDGQLQPAQPLATVLG
jgi:UPF0176 protein